MDGHTSVTMNGILHHIVFSGCVVAASLLHLFWYLVKVYQQCKTLKFSVLHLMYVVVGFGKRPFWGQHLLDYFLGWGRVAGAGFEYY